MQGFNYYIRHIYSFYIWRCSLLSIKFVYGRSGSGKSFHCLDSIKKKIEKGGTGPYIIIVPEQFSFQMEKNIIEKVGHQALLYAKVFSFKRLANYVIEEVGGAVNEHIDDPGKNVLLYKIIDENRKELKVFGKGAIKQGLISNMLNTIKEFKKYDVDMESLKESVENIENVTFRSKLQDVILVFSKFQEELCKNYIDDEDVLGILIDKIDASSVFNSAEVWVDEFSSFTPQEYRILQKIMNRADRMNINLCMSPEDKNRGGESTDLFFPTKITEKKLLEIAQNIGISYEKPLFLKDNPCFKFKSNPEMQHLERNIFSYPYCQYSGEVHNINVFKSLNRYTEVENTASDIIKLCRDKGFRFKDIAVVSGSLDNYENIVRSIFDQYEIPYFIDKKRSIYDNPIIVLIVSVIEIIAKNWSYESVFRYLKTGLLDIETEDIDLLENYVLENGIKGKQWVLDERWDLSTSYSPRDDLKNMNEDQEKERSELLDRINHTRDKVRGPILKLLSDIKGRRNGREKCLGLYNFLCSIEIPQKVENIIKSFKEESRIDKANEYTKIWDLVVYIMDQIVNTVGDEVFSVSTFGKVLVSGFSEYEIGVIPASLDQVTVGDISRIRSHDVKALYIVGASDGVFPPCESYDGIFTDGDREELMEHGVELREGTRYRAFEEQFLIYTTLTLADTYLMISYPMGDENGKTMRPSIVVSRIKKIFPKFVEYSDTSASASRREIEDISVPGATFNKLVTNLKNISSENFTSESAMWLDVYRWYANSENWSEKLNKSAEGLRYTNNVEIADTKKVRKLYGRHLNVSVSKLENFTRCPFSYFVKYGLMAEERKIYNLTPPDIGTFMHDILKRISDKLSEEGRTFRDVDKNWCSENVNIAVREALEKKPNSILNRSKRYRHAASRIEKILSRASFLISEHIKRGSFTPGGFEVSFEKQGDYPPISVSLHSGEEASLSGRVDRVDLMEKDGISYVRVVDYKSGTKEFDISKLYHGLQLQLLVYLDAMLEELEKRSDGEVLPGGILYFKLDDPIIKGEEGMSLDEIEKRINKSLKMNGLILDNMDVINGMDAEMQGASDIVPVSLKKDKSISSRSSVAKKEQFDLLRRYVKITMSGLCERILEGDIEISPYKENDKSGCDFCSYSSICQFDNLIEGSQYNVFEKKSTEDIWKDIKQSVLKNK